MKLLQLGCALAVTGILVSFPVKAETPPRDGSHDFDFCRGAWHTHATQVLDPFAGGTQTMTLDGTKIAHPLWDGRGWLEEIEADGPKGHWEGATLFLYDAKSGQWSQTYLDSEEGQAETPAIGSFKDGRAEFFSMRPIRAARSSSAGSGRTSRRIPITMKSSTRRMAAGVG